MKGLRENFQKASQYENEEVNEKVWGKLNKAQNNLENQKVNFDRKIEMRKEQERLKKEDVDRILER